MTIIPFLLPAFIVAFTLMSSITLIIWGAVLLIDGDGWEQRISGFFMVIIPLTLLIAFNMEGIANKEKKTNVPVQVEAVK